MVLVLFCINIPVRQLVAVHFLPTVGSTTIPELYGNAPLNTHLTLEDWQGSLGPSNPKPWK
jgi:hypothetical protein